MNDRKKKMNILYQFFGDKNVNFPEHPKLVNGIHVYEAPKGVGIQFRGGTEKFLIKGADSYKIWNYLKKVLDGMHTLEEIIETADKDHLLDRLNVGIFLKTLHCYHLLEPDPNVEFKPIEIHFDIFSQKQAEYYGRVVPLSGLNKSGQDVLERIRNCKVLLIVNEIFAPIVSYYMQMTGFHDMGFLVIGSTNTKMFRCYISKQVNVMTYEQIGDLKPEELRNLLSQKIADYQYIFTTLSNPNIFFLNEISRMCTIFNHPMLSISIKDNDYEVGPFYFPEMKSPCISCYNLREQSYRLDAAYEFIYQRGLKDAGKLTDDDIKGFDYNAFSVVLNLAISEFKNALAKISHPKLIGNVLRFNSLNYMMSLNSFFKVPGCASCDDVNKRQ